MVYLSFFLFCFKKITHHTTTTTAIAENLSSVMGENKKDMLLPQHGEQFKFIIHWIQEVVAANR